MDNFFFYSFTDFIIFFFHFRQWDGHNCQNKFFFFLHYRQWDCHNCQNNFFFFFLHYLQWHCHNCLNNFFFSFFGNGITAIAFFLTDRQHFGQRNFGNSVAEIPLLSLSPFFFFSLLIFVEFRQHCCRNSFSLLILPISLK